jgi:hypothetical protein
VRERFGEETDAVRHASGLIAAREPVASLALIGDFLIPPAGGAVTRDFQTLHFDFGLPLDPGCPADIARYTALHIPARVRSGTALTRLVPLAPLLGGRTWPGRAELLARLRRYGETHGAWDGAEGYLEGSLARLVEAAAGSPSLPSVKADPGFLCGKEFDTLLQEQRFFARHGLPLAEVQVELALQPGELLVFDNLALAHGRRGVRQPGELRQLVFGERAAAPARQRHLREALLGAFARHARAASPDEGAAPGA